MSIYRAPKVLILHLKRFKQKGLIRKEKNETKVNFPPLLDMSPYVIDPRPIAAYAEDPKIKEHIIPPKYQGEFTLSSSQEPLYELYAVSNHYGGLGGGHYTAYAKNGGKWYDFNDSSVRGCNEGSVGGSGAYMLFYKRKD
jgi:ubiquitin carboxyl-terminal hydrolase 4/11